MEYIYFNGRVFAIDIDEASNEDFNNLLDWIQGEEENNE